MGQIIGFTGLAGSGKNTVANIIQKLSHKNFIMLSFGSALKDITATMFNWPRELLEGDTLESRNFRETKDVYWSEKFGKDWTPRIALQWLGTDVMRNQLDKDFWYNIGMKKINDLPEDTNVLITDVRFRNEIDGLKSIGAKICRVCLGETPQWFTDIENYYKTGKLTGLASEHMENHHCSEWEWIGYDRPDYIIHPMEKGIDLLENIIKDKGLLG